MFGFIHQSCFVESVSHEDRVLGSQMLNQRLCSGHLSLTKNTEVSEEDAGFLRMLYVGPVAVQCLPKSSFMATALDGLLGLSSDINQLWNGKLWSHLTAASLDVVYECMPGMKGLMAMFTGWGSIKLMIKWVEWMNTTNAFLVCSGEMTTEVGKPSTCTVAMRTFNGLECFCLVRIWSNHRLWSCDDQGCEDGVKLFKVSPRTGMYDISVEKVWPS